jgi:hypothetical protein
VTYDVRLKASLINEFAGGGGDTKENKDAKKKK